MKDRFSIDSDNYLKYRPTYPKEIIDFLCTLAIQKENIWDCATGNGQLATMLSSHFQKIFATDISQNQLDNAPKKSNIFYSKETAEHPSFEDNFFDLIVIGQAIHWFDFDQFYRQVMRTARQHAFIAILGYGMLRIMKDEWASEKINELYFNTLKLYWDVERKYIDNEYHTIPFPFSEMETPNFINKFHWNTSQLFGYLNTWSAIKNYQSNHGFNPLDELKNTFEQYYSSEKTFEIQFPILFRLGKIFD